MNTFTDYNTATLNVSTDDYDLGTVHLSITPGDSANDFSATKDEAIRIALAILGAAGIDEFHHVSNPRTA